MKKYYQAALALTSILSLTALLFYRHEYNKLRFVLQVFNYFGTPIQKGEYNCSVPISIGKNYNSEFTLPTSTWQMISENLHIYSAYYDNDREIRAIGVGKNINDLKYSCHVLFDNDVETIVGIFSYKVISNISDESVDSTENNYYHYLLFCKLINVPRKIIIGVQFKNIIQKNFDRTPIIPVHTLNHNVNNNKNDNVICIAPPTEMLLKNVDMISFLAFHHYIGWNNFIVYDFGISYVVSNSIKSIAGLSDAQWNFTYTAIPWNFPYAQISHKAIRKIIETDCIYRAHNKAKMAMTLSWNEYINLRYHKTVENVLIDIANENEILMTDKFRLNTLIFCLPEINDNSTVLVPKIFKSADRLKKINKYEPHYIFKLSNILNDNITEQDLGNLIFINRYQQCNVENKREIVRNDVLKFSENISNTKIFQYYMTGKLFGH